MADASVNKFETTVLSALQLAQDELISAGMESSQTNEAFRELKICLSSVSKRHFGGIRQQHKHVLLAAFPMLTSMSKRWYKTFMRRMTPRCGVKNPWRCYCFGKSQQGSIWHGSTNCYQKLLRGYHAQYKQVYCNGFYQGNAGATSVL